MKSWGWNRVLGMDEYSGWIRGREEASRKKTRSCHEVTRHEKECRIPLIAEDRGEGPPTAGPYLRICGFAQLDFRGGSQRGWMGPL